jgi:D-psicose/D-tagatose/L-ribulose 3-epimerase
MRLTISNLAWPANDDEAALARVRADGAAGVEIAPTRIAPWDELDERRLAQVRRRIEGAGLTVSSLQAILYNVPGAQLLGDARAFAAMGQHFKRVAEIAGALGAKVAVFGAPKNRVRGEMRPETASALAAERLARLGDCVAPHGLKLGVEPVPAAYGSDFLMVGAEVIELVREIDHPAVRVHLDTGCALLAGDSIADLIRSAGSLLTHFHASEPRLGPFAAPASDHAAAAAALESIDYRGWVSIEMLPSGDVSLVAVSEAIAFVRTTYGAVGAGKN